MHGPFHHNTQNEKEMCPVCDTTRSTCTLEKCKEKMFTIEMAKGGWKAMKHVEPMTKEEAENLLVQLNRWNIGTFRIMEV